MPQKKFGGPSDGQHSAIRSIDSSQKANSQTAHVNRRFITSKRLHDTEDPRPAKLVGLFLTATPIGNMGDITLRALQILSDVDIIACEDTRITRRLLERYNIKKKILSYHDYNAEKVRPRLLKLLSAGVSVALVSDSGTPLISDPGFKLVLETVDVGIPVTSIPGPTALISALILSALPNYSFYFGGFLPIKSGARKKALSDIRWLDSTLIFYESAKRLKNTLLDMLEILGPRQASICRELTKLHEEVIRTPLDVLASRYASGLPPKGEIIIVLSPPIVQPIDESTLDAKIRAELAGQSLRDAVAKVSSETGVSRKDVYKRALSIKT